MNTLKKDRKKKIKLSILLIPFIFFNFKFIHYRFNQDSASGEFAIWLLGNLTFLTIILVLINKYYKSEKQKLKDFNEFFFKIYAGIILLSILIVFTVTRVNYFSSEQKFEEYISELKIKKSNLERANNNKFNFNNVIVTSLKNDNGDYLALEFFNEVYKHMQTKHASTPNIADALVIINIENIGEHYESKSGGVGMTLHRHKLSFLLISLSDNKIYTIKPIETGFGGENYETKNAIESMNSANEYNVYAEAAQYLKYELAR